MQTLAKGLLFLKKSPYLLAQIHLSPHRHVAVLAVTLFGQKQLHLLGVVQLPNGTRNVLALLEDFLVVALERELDVLPLAVLEGILFAAPELARSVVQLSGRFKLVDNVQLQKQGKKKKVRRQEKRKKELTVRPPLPLIMTAGTGTPSAS